MDSSLLNLLDIAALCCLMGAVVLLVVLSVIDLRVWLLPNKYVFAFAVLGLAFQAAGWNRFGLEPQDIALGAAMGFGLLWLIRAGANAYYKQDSLGLGDVKLLGAAGIWLGLEGVLFALTIGAFAGLLHGLGYALYKAWKDKTPIHLRRLAIPAGPGFAVGIVLIGGWMYCDFITEVFYGWMS